MRRRMEKRRAKRKKSKREEEARRKQADEYQADAIQSARDVQANLPKADLLNEIANIRINQQSAESRATQDAGGLAAQRRALGQQQEIADQGYTAQDEATMQAANRAANRNEAAQRQAIQQNAAMRGQAGGGLAMMGALQAQQSGANRSADQAAQVGQNRIAARQQGVSNLAQQGSALAGQGLAESQMQGKALDAFNDMAMQARANVPQQTFNNQLAASQNFQGIATQGAAYGQQTADAERERRNSVLSALSMGNYK